MNKDLLLYYLNRHAQGTLSAEDKLALAALLQKKENQQQLDQLLGEDWAFWEELNLDFPSAYADIKAGVMTKIAEGVQANKPAARIGIRRHWLIAAAVILLIAVNGYLLVSFFSDDKPAILSATDQPILPGKEGAILTLANGREILLDTIQNARIDLDGGISARVVDGSLVYEGIGDALLYNSVSTPKGRQFQVSLPDGTRVWLNAASSIHYPTSFAGLERRVQMQGEAYFEVAKDSKPFIIEARANTEITVLGTHFNINSYDNENDLSATVLEGSVRVTKGTNGKELGPGQQARVTETIQVFNGVNTAQIVAWKDGLFDFEGMGLQEVMKQLERWYDIEVVYGEEVPAISFWGGMTKDITLEDLLAGLKQSGVNFRIEGRKLIVLP